MKTLKEQLLDLGLFDSRRINSKKLLSVDGELANHLKELFLLLTVSQEPLDKFYRVINQQKLSLSPKTKRELRAMHTEALQTQFIDTMTVADYFYGIDFASARAVFSRRLLDKRALKKRGKNLTKKPLRKDKKILAVEKIDMLRNTTKIGLGIESSVKIPRVRREDVAIDQHTTQKQNTDKTILYAAGHSLKADSED